MRFGWLVVTLLLAFALAKVGGPLRWLILVPFLASLFMLVSKPSGGRKD